MGNAPTELSSSADIEELIVTIDLTYDPHVEKLVEATRKFVRGYVLPIEDEHFGNITDAGGDALRRRIQAAAREDRKSVV